MKILLFYTCRARGVSLVYVLLKVFFGYLMYVFNSYIIYILQRTR